MKPLDVIKSLLDKLTKEELSELKVIIISKQFNVSSKDTKKAVENLKQRVV